METTTEVKDEILKIVNIEDNSFCRYLYSVEWRELSKYYCEAWALAIDQYQPDDDFETLVLENIENALDDRDWLTSYEEKATSLVSQYHDELFTPSEANNYEILPEVRHSIAEMEEQVIIDIIAEALSENDDYSLKECVIQSNCKVRVGYSPNYEDYDTSRIYAPETERTDVSDGNFLNALRFFRLQPSKLNALVQTYSLSDEMKALPDFKEPFEVDIASNERALLIIENAYKSWVPVLMFDIEIADLLKLKPTTSFKVENGGHIAALDLLNGAGYGESLEKDCYKVITIKNSNEFLNFCDNTHYDRMFVEGWCIVASSYKVDLTIL